MIRTRLYRAGLLERKDFDPALVSDYLEDAANVLWLDVAEPSSEELAILQEEFDLHPLAIEDASHEHQRPKIERYRNHIFLVMHAARFSAGRVVTCEVDVFLDEQFIITVRKDSSWSVEQVLKRWDTEGPMVKHGVGFLLHGLVDAIVDEYVIVTEALGEQLDQIEDRILQPANTRLLQEELFTMRRRIVTLRRATYPMRDAMADFLAIESFAFHEDLRPYFADVSDHLNRVTESSESMSDLLNSALNLHLSVSTHRLNDIMRKVTSWAAIIGVATTIAGIYGMNFELFPAGDSPYSFWIALALIALCSVALFWYFRRKGWL